MQLVHVALYDERTVGHCGENGADGIEVRSVREREVNECDLRAVILEQNECFLQ